MKQCTKCNEWKDEKEFRKDKKGKGGIRANCKECDKKLAMDYYAKNKEKQKERRLKYYSENKDKVNERGRGYHASHKERDLISHRKWVLKNPEKTKEIWNRYYKNNQEEIIVKRKEYYKTHEEERKIYYKENKINTKNWRISKKYGITIKDYDKMYNAQKGCCAICGIHQENLNFDLAVDHNHITKKIRGLLCQRCNMGLGNFKDNIKKIQKAILYLKTKTNNQLEYDTKNSVNFRYYSELLAENGNACSICGDIPKRLHLDHDHKTNKIRGLICSYCNCALGNFSDNTIVLKSAIKYLKENDS